MPPQHQPPQASSQSSIIGPPPRPCPSWSAQARSQVAGNRSVFALRARLADAAAALREIRSEVIGVPSSRRGLPSLPFCDTATFRPAVRTRPPPTQVGEVDHALTAHRTRLPFLHVFILHVDLEFCENARVTGTFTVPTLERLFVPLPFATDNVRTDADTVRLITAMKMACVSPSGQRTRIGMGSVRPSRTPTSFPFPDKCPDKADSCPADAHILAVAGGWSDERRRGIPSCWRPRGLWPLVSAEPGAESARIQEGKTRSKPSRSVTLLTIRH